MKKPQKAFTLVELIVVIVILSILATIAFLSFNNYSWTTRDSNRLSDINSISKSIELYLVKTWVYPTPDNSFTITYSWWNVWYQWTIWDTLYRKISSNINKKPIDPLNNSEYIYSLLSYGNSYQIKSNYEWDSVWFLSPINKVQAATWNPKIAYIKWTYQWIVVKTTTWSTICILATPSIITNTWTVWNTYEIWTNALSWTLLYHWQSTSSWIYYNPNKPIYCSTSLPTNDTNSWLTNIASWIINAYSWTIVTTINPKIKDIVNTSISQLSTLWSSIVSWQLGGGVSNNGTSSSIIPTNWSSSSTPWTSCFTIKTNYPSSADWIYWIKPDSNPAFQVYCDMTNNWGWWTLVVWINAADRTHANINAVTPWNLISVSWKWKYSDTVINSIKSNWSDNKPVFRFTCNTETWFFKAGCVFSAVVDAAWDCVWESYTFDPPSYWTSKYSQGWIAWLANWSSWYQVRLLYADWPSWWWCDIAWARSYNWTVYVR